MTHADQIAGLLDRYIDDQITTTTGPLREQLQRAADNLTITRRELDAALERISELENTPPPAPAPHPEYGVPAGTKLQKYTGPAAITTPGATFRRTLFTSRVDVRAPGVTFEECAATNPSGDLFTCTNKDIRDVVLRRCTMRPSAASTSTIGIVGHDFTLDACDISGTVDGVRIHNTSDRTAPARVYIRGTRIHDLCWTSPYSGHADNETHNDAIQIESGSGEIEITDTILSAYGDIVYGNIVDNPRGPHVMTGLIVTPNVGPVSGVLVERVTFEGGYAAVNISEKSYGPVKGIVIRDARFKGDTTTGKDILAPATTRPLLTIVNSLRMDGSPARL